MKKPMILTALVLLSLSANAADSAKVRCDIGSLRDAKSCMNDEAEAQDSYEEPNDGVATSRPDLLAVLLKKLDAPASAIRKAERADYVGFMLVHTDEHEIVYYALNKGENVKPVVLYTLNIPDIPYLIEKEELPRAGLFFLGADGSDLDVYEYILQALDDIRAEH